MRFGGLRFGVTIADALVRYSMDLPERLSIVPHPFKTQRRCIPGHSDA